MLDRMAVNPYEAPRELEPGLIDEPMRGERLLRRPPMGIVILAVLHAMLGLLVGAGTVLIFGMYYRGGNPPGFPLWFAVAICGFITVLALGSSIGMWRGYRWGWWLTALFYVWNILGIVADVLHAFVTEQELPSPLSKLTQFVVHALILLYLFKSNVRAFFGLQLLPAFLSLIPIAIFAVGLLAVTFLVTYFQLDFQGE
jgi:hypothetical protein